MTPLSTDQIESLCIDVRDCFAKNSAFQPRLSNQHQALTQQPIWGAAIVAYQPGNQRILVARRSTTILDAVHQCCERMRLHQRFAEFSFSDSFRSAIQIDLIAETPRDIDFRQFNDQSLDQLRFELGVDGLRMSRGDDVKYFLPGDAYVRSTLGIGQLMHRVRRLFPGASSPAEIQFQRFRSTSLLEYCGRSHYLYRGYPSEQILQAGKDAADADFQNYQQKNESSQVAVPRLLQRDDASVLNIAERGCKWLIESQQPDGRFIYYYDGATGTTKDHEHPTRPEDNRYYNLLRHCGAVITLCLYERLRHTVETDDSPDSLSGDTADLLADHQWHFDEEASIAIERASDFFVGTLKEYETKDGSRAAYPVYNRKAKLGGAGIGLYMLCLAENLLPGRYRHAIDLVARHIVEEILPTGEFRYYKIYLDKEVTEERNPDLFSFYYPGEALLALVSYLQFCETPEIYQSYLSHIKRATRFLLVERPKTHAEHFTTLPSDGWLMMALNELLKLDEVEDDGYSDFVFGDADKMVALQYDETNSLYPDYLGSFFYEYGDHPFPDGARGEGLLAAYELAWRLGDHERWKSYRQAMRRLTWATARLSNPAESVYSAADPSMTRDGIRFKFTRQWFRIDTIQHVGSMYLKQFAELWQEEIQKAKLASDLIHARFNTSSRRTNDVKTPSVFRVALASDDGQVSERWHVIQENSYSKFGSVLRESALRSDLAVTWMEITEPHGFIIVNRDELLRHGRMLLAEGNNGFEMQVAGKPNSVCFVLLDEHDKVAFDAEEMLKAFMRRGASGDCELINVNVRQFTYSNYHVRIDRNESGNVAVS